MFGSEGLIEIYTGDGKGKTTAALGLALRASGHGAKIGIVQFMKGWAQYGELFSASKLPGVTLIHTGRDKCIFRGDETEEDFAEAARGLAAAEKFILSGEYDLVILDEVNVAIDFGLLKEGDVAALLKKKAPGTEIVLTGRNAPQTLIDIAELVTEMKEIKHPYKKGITARKGIEY
ncbi:MAG: cob(I)yrinic acid a,c-diamide adenosyltransferase [Synergistaceae bacterium]|nr:cob(I)yrinic acid a,c-diamide adenosyltransferase [Synergistaceae bacterium]